jgi:isoquinoline 1-oxidoreductase alpha subunit
MAQFNLTINGRAQSVDVDPATPLLWVLRDELDLKGTKYGCGIGMCGACTVHIDGAATRACLTPIGEVTGKVVTIEGVGETAVGARVQAAWIEVDVVQCGYCQAGQVMAAAALLTQTPRPSEAEIVAGMEGNLCRCSTYPRIVEAIQKASGQ